MEAKVDEGGGRIFDGGPALVELARADQLRQQRFRHGLARLVMERKAAQHFRLLHPVLVNLRGKLDEVPGDIGARNPGIGHIAQHAVQGVAEFMKERARIVEAQEARLALAAFGEVHHIDHDRQLRAIEFLLPAELNSSRRRFASRAGRNSRR